MQPLIFRILLVLLSVSFLQIRSQEKIRTFTKNDGLTSFPVTTTFVDSKGVVWVGTNDGLNAYTGTNWYAIKQIEDNISKSKKPLGKIIRLYEDRKRNMWVVTEYGVFFYDGKYWTDFINNEKENDYNADRIYEDRKGWIWVTQENKREFNEVAELGYSIVSGSLAMFDWERWYRFDDDVAESAAVKFQESPTYFTGILQDRNGLLWLSTLEGIYVFTGDKWLEFKEKSLEVKKVLDILEDKSGNIWAATEVGVSKYVDSSWVNYGKKQGLGGNLVYDLLEDSQGRIWGLSRSDVKFSGLEMYDGKKWQHFDSKEIQLKGTIESLIWENEVVLAFSKNGVSKFEGGNWHFFDKEDGLAEKDYTLVFRDKNKNIWLAGERGFYSYNNGTWEQLYIPDDKWEVLKVFVDNYGYVWLGTDKSGLYRYNGENWQNFTEKDGLTDDHISDIFEDKKGNVWVITKKGISMFSKP